MDIEAATREFLASPESQNHIIDTRQFKERRPLEEVFRLADRIAREIKAGKTGYARVLDGKSMISLFYEPSTRTRLSFEMAMTKLGGSVVSTENAAEFSSAVKGESLEDTIRVICGYEPDVIVMRHRENGAPLRAATVSTVPVINAGDGSNQHPTQALLDIYTVQKEIGRMDSLRVGFVGDLKRGRTVRSLTYLLSHLEGNRLFFVAPESMRLEDDIRSYMKERRVEFEESEDLGEVLPEVDVLYVTRLQKERGSTAQDGSYYVLDRSGVARMRPGSIIMHPLPRNEEIHPEVDSDPKAAYFRQSANGLYVRMALLHNLARG